MVPDRPIPWNQKGRTATGCHRSLMAWCRPFVPWDGCAACWRNEDHKNILLCDGCDLEYHYYCMQPPLPDVPTGEPALSHCCHGMVLPHSCSGIQGAVPTTEQSFVISEGRSSAAHVLRPNLPALTNTLMDIDLQHSLMPAIYMRS